MVKLSEPGPHPWWHRVFALPIGRLVVKILFALKVKVSVTGVENMPKTGGLLIYANHLSDLDPVVVQHACPRPIHFMAKSELFEMPLLRFMMLMYGTFPVRRGEPDLTAIRHAVGFLKAGEVVCIYPEGKISPTGELLPLQAGVALIARQAGVPILACGIVGSNGAMPYGQTKLRKTDVPIHVLWGEAQPISKRDSNEAVLALMTESLVRLTTGTESGLPL